MGGHLKSCAKMVLTYGATSESGNNYYEFASSFLFYLNAKDIQSNEIGNYLENKIMGIKRGLRFKVNNPNENDVNQFVKTAENYIINLKKIPTKKTVPN